MANFTPVSPSNNFAESNKSILEFWQKSQIYKKSIEKNSPMGEFVFYDGPPGTNGRPHIGHIMQSSLKDAWPRYKTMKGFRVIRKAGWDTHGLPVELTAEADLNLKNKKEIEAYGVAKFIEHCRTTVLRYRDDWVKAITRLGRFVDFEDDYLTMSNDFIQSDWWVLKQAFEKNLLYKDYKILPFCTRCGTGLSSHEVAQGYKDVTDLTITAKFRLVDDPSVSLLAWTTTPWTLLGNVGLAVGPDIEYSKIKVSTPTGEETLILATALIEANQKSLGSEIEIVGTVLGKDLAGLKYQPLWATENWAAAGSVHQVISDDYVQATDGTGIVHLALYGEDDFRIIKKHDLKRIQHVGADGIFGNLADAAYQGRFFKAEGLDVDIIKDLAAKGLLFSKLKVEHSYPHCWRCRTPLIYFARSSWFVRTTAIRDTMIRENDLVNWQPPHIKNGRFGKWLENNVDWAVSRERYWGSPINIWYNEKNPEERVVYASIKELQDAGAFFESTGQPLPSDIDLHVPVIDDVVLKSADGAIYRRESGVLDCWFNAGVMPWGQFGYPAKSGSEEKVKSHFPADFICEAIDQTRGWFYTLMAVSSVVSGKSPFKNVICTELISDAHGKKMSKSVGNVIDPIPLMEKYGADAVRWTFYENDPWQVKRYIDTLPKDALKSIFIPLWNCYSFLVTYANLDGWTPNKKSEIARTDLDKWILSLLHQLIVEVSDGMETYDIYRASSAISRFVDSLSNWYIRRSRRRFWKSTDDSDKDTAYRTLYDIMVTLTHVMAPFAPFITEQMFENLVKPFATDSAESIHLSSWPDANAFKLEPELMVEMECILEATSLARALRVEHSLKTRQPLSQLVLIPQSGEVLERLKGYADILKEEVNVKEVLLVENGEAYVKKVVTPNWARLGPRYRSIMQDLSEAIKGLTEKQIATLQSVGSLELEVKSTPVKLETEDIQVLYQANPGLVATSGKLVTVILATTLSEALIEEGDARELISVIQKQRKSDGFEISDKILANIRGEDALKNIFEKFGDLIRSECLIQAAQFEIVSDLVSSQTQKINNHSVAIALQKA